MPRKIETYGIEDPCDVVICDRKNGLASLSEFVKVRKDMDCLVKSSGETAENNNVVLYLRFGSEELPGVGSGGAYSACLGFKVG